MISADQRNKQWIEKIIRDFVETSPENSLKNASGEKAFDTPLIGFSSGGDPLYPDYKEVVGPFHWTPLEIFSATFPEIDIRPEDLTVISWILPQTSATKADNRKETFYPSQRWARARFFGEDVNNFLREHVSKTLQKANIPAIAPVLSPHWKRRDSDRYVFASNWSERHAAYAAGLGTFGLCDGLITAKGKAMRAGSVIAHIPIEPSSRPYSSHTEYCLFHAKGVCKKCIPRCPVNAISEKGKDKIKCYNHIRNSTADYIRTHYGFSGYACGLCQTGVPCESKIPVSI